MKHTENGLKVHKGTTGCKGTMHKELSDKGDLGVFELYRCDGTHTRGRFKGLKCTYVGRGKKLSEEDLEKIAAKAAADELAQQAQDDGEYDLAESDAPVAGLNEAVRERDGKESETE